MPWTLQPVPGAPGTVEIVNPAGNTEAVVWPDHSLLHPNVRYELDQLVRRLNEQEMPVCPLCCAEGWHRCDG